LELGTDYIDALRFKKGNIEALPSSDFAISRLLEYIMGDLNKPK
jgi:hypothetical protein